jgi:hypothetical protein
VFSLLELFLFESLQELLNTDKNWICSKSYGTYYGEKSTVFSLSVLRLCLPVLLVTVNEVKVEKDDGRGLLL